MSIINVQIFLVTSSEGEAPDQALLEVVQFDSNEGSLRFIIPAPKSQVSAASIFYVNTIFLDGWSPPSWEKKRWKNRAHEKSYSSRSLFTDCRCSTHTPTRTCSLSHSRTHTHLRTHATPKCLSASLWHQKIFIIIRSGIYWSGTPTTTTTTTTTTPTTTSTAATNAFFYFFNRLF